MWKAYLTILATFLIVDAAWIVTVVKPYYERELGDLMRGEPSVWAAAVFYLAYAAGILLLATAPAARTNSLKTALINGSVLGALAYGTYTVTNYAIFNDWTGGLVVSDILWGTFLSAFCAASGFLIAKR